MITIYGHINSRFYSLPHLRKTTTTGERLLEFQLDILPVHVKADLQLGARVKKSFFVYDAAWLTDMAEVAAGWRFSVLT